MNQRHVSLAIVCGLVVLRWGGGVWAQTEEPLVETPIGQARSNVGNKVMMKGIAGNYVPGPGNSNVYELRGRFQGERILVRTGDPEFPTSTAYVVFGIVTVNQKGELELQEHLRRAPHTASGMTEPPALWSTGEPPTEAGKSEEGGGTEGEGAKAEEGGTAGGAGETGKTEEEKGEKGGFPDWVLYAVGAFFIAVAVVLGLWLSVRSKRAQEEAWRRLEEERLAQERARMAEIAAQHTAGAPATAAATAVVSAPRATVEAWGALEVVEGPDKGKRFPLAGREITLGRSGGDIQLSSDDAVSSRHASVVQTTDGRLLYIDNSRNGSIVDGRPVHRGQAELRAGSEIQLGVSKVRVSVLAALGAPMGAAAGAMSPGGAPTQALDVGSRPTEVFTGCELRVLTGQLAGRTFPLSRMEIVVGRADESDVRLIDPTMSRKHATLRFEGGTYTFTNESQAGSTINGQVVQRQPLQNGDQIQMGEVKVQFVKLS